MGFFDMLRSERARSIAAACILVAGAVLFGRIVNVHYPFERWLFFRYLAAWSLTSVFVVACLIAGLRALAYVIPGPVPLLERLVLAFALGVLVFFCGTFLAGIVGILGRPFFYAWPAILVAFGAKYAVLEAKRILPALRPFGARLVVPRRPTEIIAAVFLVVSLTGVYLQVLLPQNVCADSYWYHLPIAEHYVAAGAIRRFEEGWYVGAYPQLATLVYTWAFLAPGKFFDHMILCSHLEFALFVATLPGVSVLAGRLVRRRPVAFASAALFLFPEIFLYDSNVNTGADHILAFWAAPLAIALVRLGRNYSTSEGALTGLLLAGAVSTKYQASFMFLPAALFLVVLIVKHRRLYPAVVCAAACGGVTASHWLKNWIFYKDPLYPLLYKHLPSTPFHKGADELLNTVFWYSYFMPQGTPAEKLKSTLASLVTFSFIPNDWPGFHGSKPVFGSLFTLLLPALLFVRASRRLWLLVVATHLASSFGT